MSLNNRLKKNKKHLGKWAKRNNFDAYRLYDRDIPEYPYIIDIYGDLVVVWLRLEEIDLSEKRKGHAIELENSLYELGFKKNQCIFKKRIIQQQNQKYQKEKSKEIIRTVREGELLFEVNLSDYIDTGLFLDHRPLRGLFSEEDHKNKKVLNLFSYTCALSVALAKSGAQVTSVDLSQNYLDWGKRNFSHNGIAPTFHKFVPSDCLEFIKNCSFESYDTIVVDPPTFSSSKKFKGTWDVQRDHLYLLHKCMDALRPGGSLYFSTNLRSFTIDSSLSHFKNITYKTIPKDFHDKKIHQSFIFKKRVKT